MGERNQDGGGFGEGRRDAGAAAGEQRTTIAAENARREAAEREQREHPELFTGRDRDPNREDASTADLDARAPIDADDDSERFRAKENEDESEG